MLAAPNLISHLAGSFFPQVEDPWPDTIGLGFPVTTAGIGGVLAGLAFAAATPARRDLAIKWGSVIGFYIGSALYFISLLATVISHL